MFASFVALVLGLAEEETLRPCLALLDVAAYLAHIYLADKSPVAEDENALAAISGKQLPKLPANARRAFVTYNLGSLSRLSF